MQGQVEPQATGLVWEGTSERVRVRKARGPQTGNKLQVSDIFISLLSDRRKQTTRVQFFSPLSTKLKGGFF